jgi:hypothetical protein
MSDIIPGKYCSASLVKVIFSILDRRRCYSKVLDQENERLKKFLDFPVHHSFGSGRNGNGGVF